MARDGGEFGEYFRARFDWARRVGYALCGDWAGAEELAQEAFVRLYARWTRVRHESVDAYLRTILTRLFLDRGRGQRSREKAVSEVPDRPADDRTHVSDERDAVRAALDRLPPSQRAILVLRYALDLPIDQVAGILRCSPGNVKSQAARGLQNFRAAYGEMVVEPPVGR